MKTAGLYAAGCLMASKSESEFYFLLAFGAGAAAAFA
jgi:hypothetical protein